MSILYHYTDNNGLYGIYHNRELWASLTSSSRNDSFDTTYIKQVVLELANEVGKENLFTWQALQVIHSVLNPRGSELLRDFLLHNVFYFCVDEVENDSEMSGEFGKKKIKFDSSSLLQCFKKRKEEGRYFADFEYGPVIYDVSEQKSKIMGIINNSELKYIYSLENDRSLQDYPTIIASTPQYDYSGNHFILYRENGQWKKRLEYDLNEIYSQSTMWTYFANEFYRIAPFLKNPDYSHEKEHRFAFYREKDNTDYDPLKHNRFIVLPFSEECLLGYDELE